MSKWEIRLVQVGRKRVSKIVTVEAETLPEAETKALKECSKYLMSKDVRLSDICPLIYKVLAGGRNVGRVKIVTA